MGPPALPLFLQNNHLKPLESLAGFKTVEVRLRRQNYDPDRGHDAVEFRLVKLPRDEIWMVAPLYDALRKEVGPAFGVAELYGDEDSKARYLTFRPLRKWLHILRVSSKSLVYDRLDWMAFGDP